MMMSPLITTIHTFILTLLPEYKIMSINCTKCIGNNWATILLISLFWSWIKFILIYKESGYKLTRALVISRLSKSHIMFAIFMMLCIFNTHLYIFNTHLTQTCRLSAFWILSVYLYHFRLLQLVSELLASKLNKILQFCCFFCNLLYNKKNVYVLL